MLRHPVPGPNPKARGTAFSAAAAMIAAVFLIPYQAAAARADRASVVAAMLLVAAVFNTGVAVRQHGTDVFRLDRTTILAALALTVGTIFGNYAVAASLPQIGAGMTSVVLKAQVLLIPALAFFTIGERAGWRVWVGGAIGLVGFGLIQASAVEASAAPLWALGAAVAFASMQIVTRHVIERIRPAQTNALRLWLAVLVVLALPASFGGGSLRLDTDTWIFAGIAGVLGPGLSRLCLMYALRDITASLSALIALIGPVFAFLFGYLVFGDHPTVHQAFGAVLILAAVSWPVISSVRTSGDAY